MGTNRRSLILEEEKEQVRERESFRISKRICLYQEREAQFENELENEEFILAGETNKEIGLATLKTIESLKGVSANDLFEELEFDVSDLG